MRDGSCLMLPAGANTAAPSLRIRLLGSFSVAWDDEVVAGASRQRKAIHLITLLALSEGYRAHRDLVLDRLWPDRSVSSAVNNLYYTLHTARKILESARSPLPVLRLQTSQLELYAPELTWTDVGAFRSAVAVARRSREPGAYRAALTLYTGDLVPQEPYEDWLDPPRTELRHLYIETLLEAAAAHEGRGDARTAGELLQRAIAEEPALERAHVELMRLYARQGRRLHALHQYEHLRAALRGLGLNPDAESRDLYRELQAGVNLPVTAPSSPGAGQTPGNLSHDLAGLVGRLDERVLLSDLLRGVRLVTLTGMGGVGKTRLARTVAAEMAPEYRDGVWEVELAWLTNPRHVPMAMARALGVRPEAETPVVETLRAALDSSRRLLLLDNCEHLLEACASLLESLLPHCPGLHVLVHCYS